MRLCVCVIVGVPVGMAGDLIDGFPLGGGTLLLAVGLLGSYCSGAFIISFCSTVYDIRANNEKLLI